jgi:hypothetical protein
MSFDGVGDHVGSRVNEFIRVLLRPNPDNDIVQRNSDSFL